MTASTALLQIGEEKKFSSSDRSVLFSGLGIFPYTVTARFCGEIEVWGYTDKI